MGKQITAQEMQKMGGQAKFEKVGSEGMSEMGIKGGNKLKEDKLKNDPDYYKRIRAIGVAKQKNKKMSPVDRFTNLLSGKRG